MGETLAAVSRSPATTQALAAALVPFVHRGSVLCLDGDLGAGKTCFVSGLVIALGGREPVVSPTFTLENRYRLEGRAPGGIVEVVHADLYRPGEQVDEDLLQSALEARENGALVAVEWAEPIRSWLEPYLQISLRLVLSDPRSATRELTLRPHPPGWRHASALGRRWAALSEESFP